MLRQPKRALSFESLETRAMMTGTVTATLSGGVLHISGDNKANVVVVRQIGTSGGGAVIKVEGAGTSIRDLDTGEKGPATFADVTDLDIQMNGGGDVLTVKNTTLSGDAGISMGVGNDVLFVQKDDFGGHLLTTMEAGNDYAGLTQVRLGTFLHFEGNAGNDTLTVNDLAVADPTFGFFSSIDMQDGKDKVTLNQFFDQDLELTLGSGKDSLTISNSTFLGGSLQRLVIDAGADKDSVSLTSVQTGPLTIEMGTGKSDSVSIRKCTADTADFLDSGGLKGSISGSNNLFGSQTIDPNFTHRSGDLKFDT